MLALDGRTDLTNELIDTAVVREDGVDEHQVAVVVLEIAQVRLAVALDALLQFLLGSQLKVFDEGGVAFEKLFVLVHFNEVQYNQSHGNWAGWEAGLRLRGADE